MSVHHFAFESSMVPSLRLSITWRIFPKPEHTSPMNLLSLRDLFLVSILHSSQKTKESRLLGSECCLKHFEQIECPQSKVSGIGALVPGPHFKNYKHDRQESVEETVSEWCLSVAKESKSNFCRDLSCSPCFLCMFMSSLSYLFSFASASIFC